MSTTAEKSPFEIAREALKRLTTRKLVPTPVNYQTIYNEIAGTPDVAPFPEEPLRALARPASRTPAQVKQKDQFERAVARRDWAAVQEALLAWANAATRPAPAREGVETTGLLPSAQATVAEVMEPVARLIENMLPALGTDDGRLAEQVAQLLAAMRKPPIDVPALKSLLVNFAHRLSFTAEDQAEIKGRCQLLHLIIENLGELAQDDQWLKKQVDGLVTAAAPPLTLRRLDDLERRLRDVMFRQIDAKGRTLEAQEQMRVLLATFIERLATMTDSTSAYHDRMEESARRMEQAKSIEEIAPLLKDVIGTTRAIADEIRSSRDELRTMRDQVNASQQEIAKLQHELDTASAQARHDVLTGALNRKGLDEALERELADVRRKETPLCVALLDIDNFKKLNDTRGHDTGDAALNHLVKVTRECMRAQDTLARYGGEEFVILMPDTKLDDGIAAMTRLQRALTRNYFLAGNEQLLITFSAGVAQFAASESAEEAIKRADQAMYLAKRAGKNRVLGG